MRKEIPITKDENGKPQIIWPPLNDEKCHEDYPYRTTLKKHKKEKFKYCYKEKDCALGKKKCENKSSYTDKYPDAPKVWPKSKGQKKAEKESKGFMEKVKAMFGGGSNTILFMLLLIASLYFVIKMNKKK